MVSPTDSIYTQRSPWLVPGLYVNTTESLLRPTDSICTQRSPWLVPRTLYAHSGVPASSHGLYVHTTESHGIYMHTAESLVRSTDST